MFRLQAAASGTSTEHAVLYQEATHAESETDSSHDALQVMRAVPKASRALLESASAIIAAAPSKFKVSVSPSAKLCSRALLA